MPGRTYSQIYIHAVWTVKYREPLLNNPLRKNTFERIRQVCSEKEIHLIEVNGYEDHVHILFRKKPSQCVSKILKDIKGVVSHWINHEIGFGGSFAWQEGYSAFSVGERELDKISNYIRNQDRHHGTIPQRGN